MSAIVDHSCDHYLTVAGTQAACGWALHHLATEKHRVTGAPLPLLSWTIRDDGPRLAGLAFAGTDEQRITVVRDWATHLGATAVVVPYGTEFRIELEAVSHGVEVYVYAPLSAPIEEAAA